MSRRKPKLLSGGNPQIAKAEGDAPVQAYIAAIDDWRGDVVKRVDQLIVRAFPEVHKAVKWNSPFYGVNDGADNAGWFLGVHLFTRYVKITFFRGTKLSPVPPVGSKNKGVRYLHVSQEVPLDEQQFQDWIRQAVKLPMVKL